MILVRNLLLVSTGAFFLFSCGGGGKPPKDQGKTIDFQFKTDSDVKVELANFGEYRVGEPKFHCFVKFPIPLVENPTETDEVGISKWSSISRGEASLSFNLTGRQVQDGRYQFMCEVIDKSRAERIRSAHGATHSLREYTPYFINGYREFGRDKKITIKLRDDVFLRS